MFKNKKKDVACCDVCGHEYANKSILHEEAHFVFARRKVGKGKYKKPASPPLTDHQNGLVIQSLVLAAEVSFTTFDVNMHSRGTIPRLFLTRIFDGFPIEQRLTPILCSLMRGVFCFLFDPPIFKLL